MLTLRQIIESLPTGSDADVLAAYHAQPPAYRRVPIGEVNTYLIDRFLIGRLRLARDNPAMPDQVRAFLGDLLTGIQVAATFDGTSAPIRDATAAVTGVLVQAGVMSAGEADGFAALFLAAGFGPATLGDIAVARKQIARDTLANRLASFAGRVLARHDAGASTDDDAIRGEWA